MPTTLNIDLGSLVPGIPSTADLALLDALVLGHRTAAKNNANLSKTVCIQASWGSGHFRQGAAAAILTLGLTHAPLTAAREVFELADLDQVTQQVKNGQIVPGFGNSFFRDHIDPAFKPVHMELGKNYERQYRRLEELTKAVWDGGKKVWPNAALYTAVVCSAVGFPKGVEEVLFLLPRLPVWAEACLGDPTKPAA